VDVKDQVTSLNPDMPNVNLVTLMHKTGSIQPPPPQRSAKTEALSPGRGSGGAMSNYLRVGTSFVGIVHVFLYNGEATNHNNLDVKCIVGKCI
jgi:hypothetical protein